MFWINIIHKILNFVEKIGVKMFPIRDYKLCWTVNLKGQFYFNSKSMTCANWQHFSFLFSAGVLNGIHLIIKLLEVLDYCCWAWRMIGFLMYRKSHQADDPWRPSSLREPLSLANIATTNSYRTPFLRFLSYISFRWFTAKIIQEKENRKQWEKEQQRCGEGVWRAL